MKRYTPEELAEVLRLHQLYLKGEEGGTCADLSGSDLSGSNLSGIGKIAHLAVFTGLYTYQCWAGATDDGTAWIRMGCLFKTVAEWDAIGIRASNLHEYPNDGSERSERRVRAFEFTRAEAVRMAEKVKAKKERVA